MYDYEARKIIGRLLHIVREVNKNPDTVPSMCNLISNTCREAAEVLECLLNARVKNAANKFQKMYIERL